MKVYLKTLTPIHIGTGKKLLQKDFYESHRINFDYLLRDISITRTKEFDTWIDDISSGTNDNYVVSISDVIKKFKLNKNYVQKFSFYSFDRFFGNEVNESIKDYNYNLFIPGSSLKGAFRTALLYDFLKFENLKSYLDGILTEIKKPEFKVTDSFKKNMDKKLEELVFICPEMIFDESIKKVKPKFDQKYDLLKILNVSDSTSVKTLEGGEINELNIFRLGNDQKHKSFPIFIESIQLNQRFKLDISIDIEFLKNANKLITNNDSTFGKTIYVGIVEKVKKIFNIDLTQKNIEINEEEIINTIINKLNNFGNEISNLEKKWSDSINNKNIKNSFEKFYNQQNKFKIGYDTGFSGMTIITLLLKNPDYKNKIFDIYKKLGIGKHGRGNKSTDLDIEKFPFTRKFKVENENLYPIGWCQLQTLDFADNKIVSTIETSSNQSNEIKINPDWKVAKIIDVNSKPPKIKLTFNNDSIETILPGVNLMNLGIKNEDEIYVTLKTQKSKNKIIIQSAEFKGKKE